MSGSDACFSEKPKKEYSPVGLNKEADLFIDSCTEEFKSQHSPRNSLFAVKLNVVNVESVDLKCWTCDVNDTARL